MAEAEFLMREIALMLADDGEATLTKKRGSVVLKSAQYEYTMTLRSAPDLYAMMRRIKHAPKVRAMVRGIDKQK
jgi:hypothetical protein